MSTPELLPCPFCGEKRIFLNEPSKHHRYGSINCPACLVAMPGEVRDQNELVDCWNTRALANAENAEVEPARHAQGETKPCGEPVAWRWKFNGVWYFGETPPDRYPDATPLFAHPAPASAEIIEPMPSKEAIAETATRCRNVRQWSGRAQQYNPIGICVEVADLLDAVCSALATIPQTQVSGHSDYTPVTVRGSAAQCAPQPCGDPVAWQYEVEFGEGWARYVSFHKPAGNKWQRNLSPLYAHPAPAEIVERCAKVAEDKFAGTLTSNIGKLIADDIRALATIPDEHNTESCALENGSGK